MVLINRRFCEKYQVLKDYGIYQGKIELMEKKRRIQFLQKLTHLTFSFIIYRKFSNLFLIELRFRCNSSKFLGLLNRSP